MLSCLLLNVEAQNAWQWLLVGRYELSLGLWRVADQLLRVVLNYQTRVRKPRVVKQEPDKRPNIWVERADRAVLALFRRQVKGEVHLPVAQVAPCEYSEYPTWPTYQ